MRPQWKVTSLATAMVIVAALGATSASAQQPGGEITVDPAGTFNRQGQATISGTYQCEPTDASTFIIGNLTQAVGRLARCGASSSSPSALYRRGRAMERHGAGRRPVRGGRAIASAAVCLTVPAFPLPKRRRTSACEDDQRRLIEAPAATGVTTSRADRRRRTVKSFHERGQPHTASSIGYTDSYICHRPQDAVDTLKVDVDDQDARFARGRTPSGR